MDDFAWHNERTGPHGTLFEHWGDRSISDCWIEADMSVCHPDHKFEIVEMVLKLVGLPKKFIASLEMSSKTMLKACNKNNSKEATAYLVFIWIDEKVPLFPRGPTDKHCFCAVIEYLVMFDQKPIGRYRVLGQKLHIFDEHANYARSAYYTLDGNPLV